MGVNLRETLPLVLQRRGMTQNELADATGIRRTDINALARGRIAAGNDRLERIAAALEVSPVELGAPAGAGDERGQSMLDRLQVLEAELAKERRRFDRFVRATTARLAALEESQAARGPRSARPPKEGSAR